MLRPRRLVRPIAVEKPETHGEREPRAADAISNVRVERMDVDDARSRLVRPPTLAADDVGEPNRTQDRVSRLSDVRADGSRIHPFDEAPCQRKHSMIISLSQCDPDHVGIAEHVVSGDALSPDRMRKSFGQTSRALR